MIWEIPALFTSLMVAFYGLVNQRYRLPGEQLVFWRGLVPAIILAPFLLFFPAPENKLFYVFVVTNSIIVRFADAWFFEAVARYGAGLPLRFSPITVILVFFSWLVLDPVQAVLMLDNPAQFVGIVLCLVVGLFSLAMMAKCNVTLEAMKYYMPRLFMGVFIDIFNKKAMQYSDGVSGPLYYAAIMSFIVFVMAVPSSVKYFRRNGFINEIKTMWAPGLMIGVVIVCLMLSKNVAMKLTPNPAYVSAIMMASPLWLSLYALLRGREEPGKFKPWLVFLISCVILVILVHSVKQAAGINP
ncbi:MAG: hypothetical protein PHX43_06585 [Alphaproteobacteria bacterium]|nr:hypothetical protein [Alphaproteobacteria bacterium]